MGVSIVSDSMMLGLRHIALLLIGLRFGDCQRFFNIPAGASQVQPGGAVRIKPTVNNVLNIRPSSTIVDDNIDDDIATIYNTVEDEEEERVTNRRVLINKFTSDPPQRDEAPATEEAEVEDGGPESVLRQLRKIRKKPSEPTTERSEPSSTKSNTRRVNNIFAQRAQRPDIRKTPDTRKTPEIRKSPEIRKTPEIRQRPSPEEHKHASTIEKLRASRIESSSRREQPSVARSRERPTARFQHPSNSERFGSATVFDPSDNPLGDAGKPRLQQFDDLRLSSEEEEHQSLQPLSNEFLPTCPDATFSYIIPSPTQCDLYYTCDLGTPSRNECDDGLVFSIDQVKCVPSETEDCKDRPLLQNPKGTGACERKNGVFYNNETCTDFVRCRDDTAPHEKCADGLVFDPVQKICAWR